jgi:hypothetical protein
LLISDAAEVYLNVKQVEMDERITFERQTEVKDNEPVILINKFNIKPEDVNKNCWRPGLGKQQYIPETKARIHFCTTTSWNRRQLCIHQLRSMGIYRAL